MEHDVTPRRLALPLTVQDKQTLRRDAAVDPKAFELYLRGNSHFYHPEEWTIARDLYIESVKVDPLYPSA